MVYDPSMEQKDESESGPSLDDEIGMALYLHTQERQMGREANIDEYVNRLPEELQDEVRRGLKTTEILFE